MRLEATGRSCINIQLVKFGSDAESSDRISPKTPELETIDLIRGGSRDNSVFLSFSGTGNKSSVETLHHEDQER